MPTLSEAQQRMISAAERTPGGSGNAPIGGASQYPRIQAAGIMFMAPSGLVLWVRGRGKNGFEGEWCFPGGKLELGETALQAARRECDEEINYIPEGEPVQLHRAITKRGVDYTTFFAPVEGAFPVVLNAENMAWAWAPLGKPPEPMNPGIRELIADVEAAAQSTSDEAAGVLSTAPNSGIPIGAKRKQGQDKKFQESDHPNTFEQANDCLALDASPENRTYDIDGHLHVASSVVSAAQVNDYRAEEIPGWKELGLTPGRVYALLRDPIELEKAVPTLHGKPLVIVHRAQTADDHDRDITVGTVTNPIWESPNVTAELTVWDGEAIALIESGEQSDLSCGYFYVPVMESGTYNGVHFDGRMTQLSMNHLAVIPQGRVVGARVGDSLTDPWLIIEHAILSLGY